MHDDEPITRWINDLRNGEDQAANCIWQSFCDRLLSVARNRLSAANRTVIDEEDIVLSAMKSFCMGVRRGRYPDLRNRDDLWRLLFVITTRKISDQIAFQRREKRDARREISCRDVDANDDIPWSDIFVSNEPSPEFTAECSDQLRSLLERLRHEDLKRIAVLKMEGFTNEEIAAQLDRGLATIERKLRTIREIWSQATP